MKLTFSLPIVLVLAGLLVSASQQPICAAELTRQEILAKAEVTELWDPETPVVLPGDNGSPPSDALVLFDGTGLGAWQSVKGGPAQWDVESGELVVTPGEGDIETRASFTNVQLHVEFATPAEVRGDSQGRGNSGVFLMGRYEVQVLDSYQNRTYNNGQAASVYKQHAPLVNAARPPGSWQSYDIIFQAPVFGVTGRIVRPAAVTVLHNGIVVQNHVTIQGPTEFIGAPQYQAHEAAPIKLQDHGNPVRYRNIWLREL